MNKDASRGATWPAIPQVIGQRLPDVVEQRHPVDAIAFAADEQFSRSPVDIFHRKASHLACPQTKPGQEEQDGMIAFAYFPPPITTLQQLLYLFRFQIAGQFR